MAAGFLFLLSIAPLLKAQEALKVPDAFLLFSKEELVSPVITEAELQKFLKTMPAYFKKFNEMEPQFKKEGLSELPTASGLLSDLQKGKPVPFPVPEKITDLLKKYYQGNPSMTNALLAKGLLESLLMREVSTELRFVPKALVPMLKSQGWADPKDYVRTEYQVLTALGALIGAKELDSLIVEVEQQKKEMQKTAAAAKTKESKKFAKDLMKEFDIDPKMIQDSKDAMREGLNPDLLSLVQKYQSQLDQELSESTKKK
ncbi:MAG: hypothetical protein U1F57_08605 [bacterium]